MKPSPEELLARAKLYAREASKLLPPAPRDDDDARAWTAYQDGLEARIAAAFIDGMGAGVEEVTGRLKRGLGGK